MLVELAGLRAAEELAGAIATGSWDAAPTADPGTARVLSRLIADLFMVAGRALVLENRRLVLDPGQDRPRDHSVASTTPITLASIERCVRGLAAQLLTEPA